MVETTMKDASKVEAEVEEDLYLKMKELEKDLEILTIQEEYIKDEQRHLKSEYIRAKEEVNTHFIVLNCLLSVD
jgi:26S proteasome regulatory subunit T3